MPGGLLNIIAYGNANIIVHGNPTKTFFKATYAKHTNFGMQKFRLDYEGSRDIDPNNDSVYTFKIPRHAELLMDSYLVFSIPDIYSTILPPRQNNDIWKAYQFKWIENLGTSAIKTIRIMIGTQVIQEYTGEYIRCMVERDYNEHKKSIFSQMTGNVIELNDPANFSGYNNGNSVTTTIGRGYPNVFYNSSITGPEPSIRGRNIYVPLSCWFSKNSKLAVPLVCLQYSFMSIEVTMRPIRELFTINNVQKEYTETTYDSTLNVFYQRIQPNFTNELHNLYRFLQPPPNILLTESDYLDKTNNWNADVHIIANYGFLTAEESKVFALNEQTYLIKDIKTNVFYNIAGTKKVKIESNALVTNWTWFYRRNDAYKRNEWSNYTNWETSKIPYSLQDPTDTDTKLYDNETRGPQTDTFNSNNKSTNHRIVPNFSLQHQRNILSKFAILLDGKYRENEMDAGVFNYIEKYQSTKTSKDIGLYHYNFCLETSNFIQPTGAINLNRFRNIEFEMVTMFPNVDPSFETLTICDEEGGVIGVTSDEPIYLYTYDMHLFEERYNILRFLSGNAGLLFAR